MVTYGVRIIQKMEIYMNDSIWYQDHLDDDPPTSFELLLCNLSLDTKRPRVSGV